MGSVPPVTPRSRAAPRRTISPERYRRRDAIPGDRVLSGEELDRLAEAIPDRFRAFVLTAAYSSLRWSELVALRVDRLDLVRDVNRVEEKIVESGRPIGGAPKTERSRRAVTLPHTITLELAEHLRGYPPGEDGLVFSAERGGVKSGVRPSVGSSGAQRSRAPDWWGSGSLS